MNKIKLFASIFVASFVGLAVVTVNIQANKIKAQKAEIDRVQTNNMYLMSENLVKSKLIIKHDEIFGSLRLQVDSLANALRVKPKFIDRIVYQTTTEKDTVVVEVPVVSLEENRYLIADTGKCYIWRGEVTLSMENISVKKTEFSYQNKTTIVAYRKRPHRFLFFNYGKRINFAEISSECGDTKVQEFQFTK